ncbi:6032_t:CDS:2 [Paraglomus brasilianum]|uniref:6032_t:CDS:1 n=1 Tax=Paraglomus brasilianum TaxID=144538 RepID=A0A9N9FZF9_9GLOM|nr:6032_t:CDS:2 [Paraglomus brasilianum]
MGHINSIANTPEMRNRIMQQLMALSANNGAGGNVAQKIIRTNAGQQQGPPVQLLQHQQQQQFSQTPVSISQSPVNTFTSLPQSVNNVRAAGTNVNISNLNGMINSLTQTNVGPIPNNVNPAIAAMSQGIGLTNLQPRQNNGVVSNVSSNSAHNAITTVQGMSPNSTVGMSPSKSTITAPAGVRTPSNINARPNNVRVISQPQPQSQSPRQILQQSPSVTGNVVTINRSNQPVAATSAMSIANGTAPRPGNGESTVAIVKNEQTPIIQSRRRSSTSSAGRAAKPPAPATPGNGTVSKANGTTGNQNNSVVANQVVRASMAAPSTTAQLKKLSDKEYNDAATHIKEAEKKKRRLGLHALNLSEEDIRKIELLIPELQRISSMADETLVYFWHFTRNQRGLDNVLTSRFLIEDFLKGWQQKQYYLNAESLESSIDYLQEAINCVRNLRQGKQDEFYAHLNKSPVMNQSEIENLLLKKSIDLKIPEKRERHINSGSNKRPRTTSAHEQMRRSSVISSVDEVDNEEEECSIEKMENTFKNIKLVLKDAAEKERERETRNKNGLGLPTRMDRLMIEGYMIPPRLLDSTKVFVGLGSAI